MVVVKQGIPRLGLGMAALGRPGYINLDRSAIFGSGDTRSFDAMQQQANVVLDSLFEQSLSLGTMPWIDCARSYGLSEKMVGEYLRSRSIAPSDVYVSSKWGYTYVANGKVSLESGEPHEVKDHSAEVGISSLWYDLRSVDNILTMKQNFLKQVKETEEFLGEYVDLYQIHSATFESGVLDNVDVHNLLTKCRKERGWAIGLSVSSPQQGQVLRKAMELSVDGERVFDAVQCTYNLLEQSAGPALAEARAAGMNVIIKEGMANGRLFQHPVVTKYAAELECTPDQLALGCILAQESLHAHVLSGAVTPEQLVSNLGAERVGEKLQQNPQLLENIMSECVMDPKAYWDERANLSWN